ncbi:MAG: HAMP domain-containing sensor histidine kinase [Pyrinomonadaceae bacterium]
MLWFFLNLLLLGGVFLLLGSVGSFLGLGSVFFAGPAYRLESVSRSISAELSEKNREEQAEILKRYSTAYQVEFYYFDTKANQLSGDTVELPEAVRQEIGRLDGMGPFRRPPPPANRPNSPPMRGLPRSLTIRTSDPTQYWVVWPLMVFKSNEGQPVQSCLVLQSDSFSGHGLFFDLTPWFVVAAVIILISVLFWLPFVRRMTRSVSQMTDAARNIADEDFSIRVDNRRTDELGTLGSSINDLASRLSGFVSGQKRFLGDISHELNSPLARMQFALSILEERARPEDQPHIIDVKEEVELMTKLVRELLSYSKTGIEGAAVKLEPVSVRDLVMRVVNRENSSENTATMVDVPEGLIAQAQPELLARAIANIIRNSINYAGADGEITISASREGEKTVLSIADNGPGVPDDKLEKIFDPLFRVQDDRSRSTGGTGLGLAIVKTCVEACNGKVSAQNVTPHGLKIVLTLNV